MSSAAQLGSETIVTNGAQPIAQPLVRELPRFDKGKKKKEKILPSNSSSNDQDN